MSDLATAHQLGEYIDASPTPYHAAANGAKLLQSHGFEPFDPTVPCRPGRYYVCDSGALIAWVDGDNPVAPPRMIAAHTDSPNLRIRPKPDMRSAGIAQLGVEVYGGALLNSWLDRELGLAGRVAVRNGTRTDVHLIRSEKPLLRIPQLAIHLDREINDRGLQLDRQRNLNPIWSLERPDLPMFRSWLSEQLACDPESILAWDMSCFDTQPHQVFGRSDEFIAAARLDNLMSCFAGLEAISSVSPDVDRPAVLMLFDHEEVGSSSATGADSALPSRVLEQRSLALGIERSQWLDSLSASVLLSADMAHGTHPNYVERHEPNHHVILGGGPAIKYNSNARYASEAATAAEFKIRCADAGIAVQEYSHRGDLACGSTIGPILAAQLAVPTVDVGTPQLAMHSAREMMACADVSATVSAFTEWLRP